MSACATCGNVLPEMSAEEEAEARAELEANFPGATVEDCAVICDDCYAAGDLAGAKRDWRS